MQVLQEEYREQGEWLGSSSSLRVVGLMVSRSGTALCELYELAGWEGGLRDESVVGTGVGEWERKAEMWYSSISAGIHKLGICVVFPGALVGHHLHCQCVGRFRSQKSTSLLSHT